MLLQSFKRKEKKVVFSAGLALGSDPIPADGLSGDDDLLDV
jgi:hypothetical protein